MPLILITGYPTSGKSHRAKQLYKYFQDRAASLPTSNSSKPPRIHLINDSSLHIIRSVYDLEHKNRSERSANASEKDARATVYGAVKRVLSNDDVVIVDAAGGNYIKGWRYQLYCEAKAVRTPSCVVHVGTNIQKAREVNEERLRQREKLKNGDERAETGEEETSESQKEDEEPYEPDTWENLVFRFEEPNAMARWDSPLFTVVWDDPEPPCSAIWDAMIGSPNGSKIVVRPNQATVLKPASSEGYLYELDKVTQEVVAQILEWTKDHAGEGGGEVSVGEDLVIELPSNGSIGVPALQRLRRQFITLNRKDSVSVGRIKESFVGYLNVSFQTA